MMQTNSLSRSVMGQKQLLTVLKAYTSADISQKELQKLHDALLLESTQRCLAEPNFLPNGEIIPGFQWLMEKFNAKSQIINLLDMVNASERKLFRPNRCYVCKQQYQFVHQHYHRLCPQCADEHIKRRNDSANLNGRIALITGGRIKIGFETALKLLRAGAKVIITTRFKLDAARRFMQQQDYANWQHNLVIYALDLKHIPSVESFVRYIQQHYDCLDILINNAAQTLRKPENYYQQMAVQEQLLIGRIQGYLLGDFHDPQLHMEQKLLVQNQNLLPLITRGNALDEFAEPIDKSDKNSWLKTATEVDTLEFLEVQTINATAPFLLCSKLKPLLEKSPHKGKFIINVSAMEGQFNRQNKTYRHPHTNMAKAALNMLTRTIAKEYARDDIFINSVDTGWVTQENPFPVKIRNRANGVVPPLDCVDGAARVLAPIFDAINGATLKFGCFLKDYQECEW